MSFLSHVTIGAGIGFAYGLGSSAYYSRLTRKFERQNNPYAFGSALDSFGSLIEGPFLGAAGGATLYGTKKGIKYLHAAPRSTQAKVGLIAATAIGATVAYKLGSRE